MAVFIWAVPAVVIVAVLFLGYPTLSNAACTNVEYTTDKCRKSVDHIYVEGPPGKSVSKDCTWPPDEIFLSYPKTEVYWRCGSDKERTGWGNYANKLRVSFCGDTIKWWIDKCEMCTYLEETKDWCSGASQITVESQTINKGTYNAIIKLPARQREVYWKCGTNEERTAWGPNANQLRVNYFSDGRIEWKIEICS